MNNDNRKSHPTPALTVDAVVLYGEGDDMRVLLVKRKNAPFANYYALPGGFIDSDEPPLLTVVRELKEECNLDLLPGSAIPLRARGIAGRDPRGWTITCPFLFRLPSSNLTQNSDLNHNGDLLSNKLPLVSAGDDAAKAEWVLLKDLDCELAFDHGAILCEALSLFWKYFPRHIQFNHHLLEKSAFGAPSLAEQNATSEVILFCGSFNPWHVGHLACIQSCVNNYREEYKNEQIKLIVVPDQNPAKFKVKNFSTTNLLANSPANSHINFSTNSSTSAEGRGSCNCSWKTYRNLQKEVSAYTPWVYPGFCGLEYPNPTSGWCKYLTVPFSLLMGEDSFIDLPNWIAIKELINLAPHHLRNIYVVPRNGELKQIEKVKKWIDTLNSDLRIIHLPVHKYQDISSSKLRADSIPTPE